MITETEEQELLKRSVKLNQASRAILHFAHGIDRWMDRTRKCKCPCCSYLLEQMEAVLDSVHTELYGK